MKSAYAGMVLRQVASHALQRRSQDVIFLRRQLSWNIHRLVGGEFSIPEIAGLTADDKFNMSMTFVGPWTHRLPIITAISPSGTTYLSDDANLIIAQKWSPAVLELKGPYEQGTWRYNISLGNPPDSDHIDKSAVIVVHLNVNREFVVQGFLEDQANSGIKGNQTKVVKAYAFRRNADGGMAANNGSQNCQMKCTTWYPGMDETQDTILKDDGLTSKTFFKGHSSVTRLMTFFFISKLQILQKTTDYSLITFYL